MMDISKENWKSYNIIDVLEKMQTGKTPPSKVEKYFTGKVNWFNPGDVGNNKILSNSKRKITNIAIQEGKAYVFPKGSVLLTCIGEIGRVGIINSEASSNQQITALIPNSKISSDYLYYWLIFNKWRVVKLSNSAVVPIVNNKRLRTLTIPLPPLETQKQIAHTLDTASALIEKTQAQLDALDELAQSIFLEMFGDPVLNEKGWEVKRLSDFGNWKSGGTPSRSKPEYFKNGTINWFSSGELNSIYLYDTNEKITESALKESSTKEILPYSLLLGMYDTAALKSGITTEKSSCNQAIAFAKLDESLVDTIYIYHFIQFSKNWLRRMQRGVRQKNMNLSMIKNLKIQYPPLVLQKEFALACSNIQSQKSNFQKSLIQCENLFNGLLQEIFS